MSKSFLAVSFFLVFSFSLFGTQPSPKIFDGVGVSENLKMAIPGELVFTNADGMPVTLNSLLSPSKTTILNLVYYSCPMLCNLVTTGLTDSLLKLPFELGTKYNVITLSFNPDDTIEQAQGFRDRYLNMLGQANAKDNWTFLIGDQSSINQLTDSVGFYTQRDPNTKEFAHNAVIVFIGPEAKVSRYLYGIEFKTNDVKLAISESLDKKYQSTVDRLLLFCYNYDPQFRGYTLFATNVMKIAGFFTMVIIIVFVSILTRRR